MRIVCGAGLLTSAVKAIKPAAIAVATFVSTDKFIIFPFNYGGNPLPRFLDFTFYFSYIASNFRVLMDARRSARFSTVIRHGEWSRREAASGCSVISDW